jgi:hypothetical protein
MKMKYITGLLAFAILSVLLSGCSDRNDGPLASSDFSVTEQAYGNFTLDELMDMQEYNGNRILEQAGMDVRCEVTMQSDNIMVLNYYGPLVDEYPHSLRHGAEQGLKGYMQDVDPEFKEALRRRGITHVKLSYGDGPAVIGLL